MNPSTLCSSNYAHIAHHHRIDHHCAHWLQKHKIHIPHARACLVLAPLCFDFPYLYIVSWFIFLFFHIFYINGLPVPSHPLRQKHNCTNHLNCCATVCGCADTVGSLVEVDGVAESDLGGLVDTAEVVAEEEEEEEATTAAEASQEKEIHAHTLNTEGYNVFEALVEVLYSTRKTPDDANASNGVNGREEEEEEVVVESDPEYEEEQTEDYTFVEVTVYEVQEVAERVFNCQVCDVGEERRRSSECVAVLTEAATREPEELLKDQWARDFSGDYCVDIEDEGRIVVNGTGMLNVSNHNETSKRKRGRGQSQSRRRRNRNRR